MYDVTMISQKLLRHYFNFKLLVKFGHIAMSIAKFIEKGSLSYIFISKSLEVKIMS